MLKAQKKISKRELKQDRLVTTMVQAENFFVQYKKYLSYGVAALVVLVILGVVYSNNRSAAAEKATIELSKLTQYIQAQQYDIAIKGIPEKNVMGLQKIVDSYGSTPSGEDAKIYLADAYYAQGKIDEAYKLYGDYDGNIDELKVAALTGAAACLETKKEYKQAAELFEKAGTKYSKNPSAPTNLVDAAHDYSLAGDKERAKMLLKKVKTDYPQSAEGREADRYLDLWTS